MNPGEATISEVALESRILLLPPTARDSEAIAKVLAAAGIPCDVCKNVDELCFEMARGVGSVLISEEALLASPERFIDCLGQQPVWSDLAVIVLSSAGAELPTLENVLPRLQNVSVVERPVRINTLLSIVRSSLRARHRQYEVRAYLIEQRESADKLRSSEERLRLALETGKLGVWELNLDSNDLICSAGCKANFGRGPDDTFTYVDLWSSIHPDDAERVKAAVQKTIQENADYDIEYRNIWPDGSTHWVLARARPLQTHKGRPGLLVGVTLDITQQKFAEDQRLRLLESERAARATAENASRIKDEFLATLSHELRTPLNGILGWSQILARGPRTEEDLTEGLQTIERNARAQTQIIEDLLDMSRIVSGKIRLDVQRVNLASVVQAAVDTIRPAAEAKGVRISVVLDPLPGPISGDPNRLQQIFWNLLSNAVKFTPRGQRVQVVLERVNSHLEVSVIDTGAGISAEFLPHVFDRFRQADASTTRRHGGLGLGLAIVKQLVELHGGTVRASSPGVGKGSTFVVSLPLTVIHHERLSDAPIRQADFQHAPIAPERCDNIAGLKVLVVDDEPDSRALVKRLLEDCNALVTVAGSTQEALKAVTANPPDVLVSDIGMPGEDGYSLIQRVRALESEKGGLTPAVALTAYARAIDRVSALRAGFQHHVTKPVEPSELIAVIASVAGKRA